MAQSLSVEHHLNAEAPQSKIFTTGFFTHPSSFTQHMVTKEEFTSHFWDVFKEAMLILKEFGSSESPF